MSRKLRTTESSTPCEGCGWYGCGWRGKMICYYGIIDFKDTTTKACKDFKAKGE